MFKGADFRNFCRFLCSLCGAIFSAVGVLQNAAAYSCVPGQYVNQNGGCTECPAGCWCVPGQNAATTTVANVANMCSPSSTTYTGRTYGGENLGGGAFKCPAGFSYSSASSDSATDCYGSVGAGYYIHSSGFKSASTDSCPVGSYCPGGKYYSGPNGGDQGVYACPNHSTTASQTSSSINQCICDSGYYMNGSNCISVGVDYYRIYPDNSRYACSANATTNGSTGASYCTCKTGYSGGGGTSDPSGANCVATNTGCATNQIDAGGTCQDVKFTVTTTQMTANDTFKWTMSAAGTFYVDCGDDGVLSGTGVSGKTINRANNTSRQQYTCSYTNSGTHTIKFGGVATGYNSSTYSNYAAIRFGNISSNDGNTPTKIAGISGSLGAIFGTIGNGDTLSKQPRFAYTFFECTGLTGSIPENLFAGISGAPASYMFAVTFYGCSGLTGSIPETLFSGISGAPASYMFGSTFSGCSGLTGSIPENLFAGVEGAPADNMFSSTFAGCSGLTGSIPENLFAGISGAPASYMFGSTFSGCAGLTGSIPENLFAGVEGAPAQSMFSFTFSGCTGLTGSIPETLFSGISGAPASYMFGYTFYDCSNLTGFTDGTTTTSYVPASFLSSINTDTSISNQVSGMFSSTGLANPCPANTYAVTRAQFDNAGKPWCAPCPDGLTSPAGATSVDQCVEPSYTITYNLNGGTGCSNTTYTSSDTVTLCTPTRTGYTFDGWYGNVDLTGSAVTTIPTGSTGNKTYWAKWTEKIYKIRLYWQNTCGGIGTPTILYEKYGVGFYSDAAATQQITSLDVRPPRECDQSHHTITYKVNSVGNNLFDYSTGQLSSDATIITGNDTYVYVTWEPDIITTEPGYQTQLDWYGTYISGEDGRECSVGYYCPGTTEVYVEPALGSYTNLYYGRVQCPQDEYPNSDAGATAKAQCYTSCPTLAPTGYSLNPNGHKYCNVSGTANDVACAGDESTCYTADTCSSVFLDPTYGDGGSAAVTVTYDAAMPTISIPSRTGYTFAGYYDTSADTGGTKYYNTDGTSAHTWDKTSCPYTLYARWTANTYTVILDKNAADAVDGTTSVTATYDADMPLPITLPTRTGYIFNGYWDSATGGTQYYGTGRGQSTGGNIVQLGLAATSAHVWDKNDNQTLYAHWIPGTKTISLYHMNGNSAINTLYAKYDVGVSVNSNYTPIITTNTNPITKPTRTGYTFDGYYKGYSQESMGMIADGDLIGLNPDSDVSYNYDTPLVQVIDQNGYITSDGANEIRRLTAEQAQAATTGYVPQMIAGQQYMWIAKWTQCAAGTYWNNGTCVPCAMGAYSAAGATECIPCQNGTSTSGTGATTCSVNCANSDNVSSWLSSALSNNVVDITCKIDSCNQGNKKISYNPLMHVDLTEDAPTYYSRGTNVCGCTINNRSYNTVLNGVADVSACSNSACKPVLDTLNAGEWRVDFSYGTIKGTTKCSATAGTALQSGGPSNTSGEHCWCQMTSYELSNGISEKLSAASWVYLYNSGANCSHYCPQKCARDYIKNNRDNSRETLFALINSAQSICTPEYTITYHSNGGTEYADVKYTIESPTIALPTPTKSGYIFTGWYDNVNLTGTAVTEIASGSTGNKEYWAKWEIANGYYLDNDIAVQCPVGYRDGPGANNIYMCYANGATSCSAYLSFDSANVNYATYDVSLPCKRYYGTDRCVPDNLAACNISSFSCLSNYDTVAWNFESLTTPNSFAVKKASRGECYWMDVNSSLEDCDNPVFSDIAPGDWKWEYPDKTFYGVARCSATAGTNFASGNPDFTNTGDNCWCRIEKINNQTAVSSWFNISSGGCSNCANACGIAAFVSSDYVGAITGTLTQQCVAPSTISLSYTDELDDTIYDGPNSCTINDTFTLPPAPTKTGYTFTGWTLVEN